MGSYLPLHDEGLLPYFLLIQGALAWIHTAVCYTTSPRTSLKQFSGPRAPPPHALLAHVYGIKNFYSGAIRLYAAYNITNGVVYDLAMFTFAGVLALYLSEVFVYRCSNLREVAIPYVMAGGGLIWLWMQRSFYVID